MRYPVSGSADCRQSTYSKNLMLQPVSVFAPGAVGPVDNA
jgi:hypothetical protein